MDIVEFVNFYLDSSEDVRCQIEEIVYKNTGRPVCQEEASQSSCITQAPLSYHP